MRLRQFVVAALIVLLAVPPGWAREQAVDPGAWRAFAEKLEPNAYVRVRLKNGTSVKGHVVLVGSDALRVNPRTRLASPLRELPFGEILTIDQRKEPRWNPAVKTLLGVGIGVGTLLLMYAAAFAGVYD